MLAARPRAKLVPTILTLRTRSSWFDRIHDYMLPQFFAQQMTRTNQALYYSDELLEFPGFKFCAQNPHRPFACFDFWTNFARHCVNAHPLCNEVSHVWNHILARRQILPLKYTQSHLDLLIVEGQTDPSKAAISFQGKKFSDIVVTTRARTCSTSEPGKSSSSTNCSTITIDEFRYESPALSTTVTSFYFIVASLRFVGQTYMWLRLVVLFLGCFYARSAESQYNDATLTTRFVAALRTMFLVPSQVVIYRSIFPISCHVVAHIIDSATVYEFVSQSFTTSRGLQPALARVSACQCSLDAKCVGALDHSARDFDPSHPAELVAARGHPLHPRVLCELYIVSHCHDPVPRALLSRHSARVHCRGCAERPCRNDSSNDFRQHSQCLGGASARKHSGHPSSDRISDGDGLAGNHSVGCPANSEGDARTRANQVLVHSDDEGLVCCGDAVARQLPRSELEQRQWRYMRRHRAHCHHTAQVIYENRERILDEENAPSFGQPSPDLLAPSDTPQQQRVDTKRSRCSPRRHDDSREA